MEAKAERLALGVDKQRKRDFLLMWVLAKVQARRNRLAAEARRRNLSHRGFRALSFNRLSKLEEKYQMLRVIQFFSENRSEVLLSFSRAFLLLSCKHSQAEARVCSTTLAKYALEQWKVNRDRIRRENYSHQRAQRLYICNLARKGLRGLREGVSVICHKRSLKLSVSFIILNIKCFEFYHVGIMKKVLQAFSNNSYEGRKR